MWAVFNPKIGGSSPRVWGTSDYEQYDSLMLRFIPTCVGNIQKHTAGESVHIGSSPRVWGTCYGRLSAPQTGRFIPTCVGNMAYRARDWPRPSVHPHVCGEHMEV